MDHLRAVLMFCPAGKLDMMVESHSTDLKPGYDAVEVLTFIQDRYSTTVTDIATADRELFAWMQGVDAGAAGHFLSSIVRAAFHADGEHAQMMYPLLKQLQAKHPKYQREI